MREKRLLEGKRIAVTRAEDQSGALIERLRGLGAEALACPTIAIAPPADYGRLDAAIGQLDEYDWLIVTSANGARALLGRMAELGRPGAALARLSIGAIGPATAEALAEHGLRAGFMPASYVAESILEEIGDVAGRRFVLPRADIAREKLPAALRERGALVDDIAAYRTVPGPGARQLAEHLSAHALDAVTFSSSSTVRYLLDGMAAAGIDNAAARELLREVAVVCIGPITAATAREHGLRVDVVARDSTAEGLVAALLEWFAAHPAVA